MHNPWVILAAILATSGVGYADSNGTVWSVRSYLGDSTQLCDATAVELVLNSKGGETRAVHRVVFDGTAGVHDEAISENVDLGTVILEMVQVDCAGERTTVATLPTRVTAATRLKQICVAAAVHESVLEPRYVEIDTYTDAETVTARREGATLVLSNQGHSAIHLCDNSAVVSIRDELLVDEDEWESGPVIWDIPPGVLAIEPGSQLRIEPSIVKKYIPPHSRPKAPRAARVMLAITPDTASHTVLGDIPHGFLGFPGCDSLYVTRGVTEADRIWIHEDVEP